MIRAEAKREKVAQRKGGKRVDGGSRSDGDGGVVAAAGGKGGILKRGKVDGMLFLEN